MTEELTGCVLKKRFLIGNEIDRGSFGSVFKIVDLQDKSRPLVAKICKDYKLFAKEITAMKNIWRSNALYLKPHNVLTPEVVEFGMIMVADQNEQAPSKDNPLMSYLIMPRYGKNLDTYFEAVGKNFSKASIYHLGLTVLEILEQIHASGYVYNDLKLDNLLIGFHD